MKTLMILGLVTISMRAQVASAAAENFNFKCFTNYAEDFAIHGKVRVVGTRDGEALKKLELRYFNGREFVLAPTSIDSDNNPDLEFRPRVYRGYARYFLNGNRPGEGYELLLPKLLKSKFKGYLAFSDFEDGSKRYELLCQSND